MKHKGIALPSRNINNNFSGGGGGHTRYSTETSTTTWVPKDAAMVPSNKTMVQPEQFKYIYIEDVQEESTAEHVLVRDFLKPYLRDLYADLVIRASPAGTTSKSPSKNVPQVQVLDNLTFLPFTRLPLILAERLFAILSRKHGESGVV
jgi:hypothetical protein